MPISPPEAVVLAVLDLQVFCISRIVTTPISGAYLKNRPTSQAAAAAETYVMHRMTQMKSVPFAVAIAVSLCSFTALVGRTSAEPPRVQHANIDMAASGFVMPAGGMTPSAQVAYGMSPMAAQQGMPYGAVAPVGYSSGASGCECCDSGSYGPLGMGYMEPQAYGSCDGYGACETGCCPPVLSGGVLGKMASDSEMCGTRHMCFFCRGGGCSACQTLGSGSFLGLLECLKPYGEAGLCAQRWYDISAEALLMGRNTRGVGQSVLSTMGVNGTPAILGSALEDGGTELGVRLSGALLFGPGGSLEVTYMGGHEWKSNATTAQAVVQTRDVPYNNSGVPGNGNDSIFREILNPQDLFYSFVSDFGLNPPAGSITLQQTQPPVGANPPADAPITVSVPGGFDDTDASIQHSFDSKVTFHSGEFNYRRRTVGPYCRFQGSWLAGLRIMRYDERLGFNAVGILNDGTAATIVDGPLRFLTSTETVKNNLFGAQIGGDLWWNIIPGVSMGVEGKAAWMKNEARQRSQISSNSIVGGGTGDALVTRRIDDGTVAGELQAKLVYRLSHSWTFRSAYYLLAIDEVGFAQFDRDFIRLDSDNANVLFDSLIMNGYSFGAEYTW